MLTANNFTLNPTGGPEDVMASCYSRGRRGMQAVEFSYWASWCRSCCRFPGSGVRNLGYINISRSLLDSLFSVLYTYEYFSTSYNLPSVQTKTSQA